MLLQTPTATGWQFCAPPPHFTFLNLEALLLSRLLAQRACVISADGHAVRQSFAGCHRTRLPSKIDTLLEINLGPYKAPINCAQHQALKIGDVRQQTPTKPRTGILSWSILFNPRWTAASSQLTCTHHLGTTALDRLFRPSQLRFAFAGSSIKADNPAG